jgi:hypothetical protein
MKAALARRDKYTVYVRFFTTLKISSVNERGFKGLDGGRYTLGRLVLIINIA